MSSPLLLGKVANIERTVARALQEYAAAGTSFASDFTRQDAAILNILRACEACIDVANILVRAHALGVPQSSRHSFQLLSEAGVLPDSVCLAMQRMIGFRNVAVHQYQTLELPIVEALLRDGLRDLLAFAEQVARLR